MSRGKRVLLSVIAVLVAGEACAAWFLYRERIRTWIKGHLVHLGDRRDELDERAVFDLFELGRIGAHYCYDAVAHLLPVADQERELIWAEHPDGKLTIRTNNLGFRDDEPTLVAKRGPRILVAGDSQVAGPLENARCFTALLEARLRALPGREALEVLNAGVAYTGPACYLGVLKKYLELAPDVFVAVFYPGNDLWDDLKIGYYLDGWTAPWGDEEYKRVLLAAMDFARAPVSQGLNQAFRWKHFPSEPERALRLVIASFREMQALCSAHGIRFLALVLPTKSEVEPEDVAALEAVSTMLGLSPAEAGVNRALALRFVQALESAGIRCLDPFEEMRRAPHPLYWREDHHLGPGGHALIAEILERELRDEM